jgi:hypothetical protein
VTAYEKQQKNASSPHAKPDKEKIETKRQDAVARSKVQHSANNKIETKRQDAVAMARSKVQHSANNPRRRTKFISELAPQKYIRQLAKAAHYPSDILSTLQRNTGYSVRETLSRSNNCQLASTGARSPVCRADSHNKSELAKSRRLRRRHNSFLPDTCKRLATSSKDLEALREIYLTRLTH